MGSSSKPRAESDSCVVSARGRLLSPIAQQIERYASEGPLAVGLSGGPDSATLAICAAEHCRRIGVPLFLFHVHHGLLPEANAWAERVLTLADLLNTPVTIERVFVDLTRGLGIEAAARSARHEALLRLAHARGVRALMLAHHRQDQAETVLLRLLRGSGPDGLAAMQPAVQKEGVWLLRPWLDEVRADILTVLADFRQTTGWAAVDDPSNRDPNLGRGALRESLVPLLNQRWPAWTRTLARHARQAQEAHDLLAQHAQALLAGLGAANGDGLSLAAWRALRDPERVLVLRRWLANQGLPMPSERRLAELVRQLAGVHQMGHDRSLAWRLGDWEVRCVGGVIQLHAKI